MALEGLYEFLELTHSEGLMIAKARDAKSGKIVQVHMFPADRTAEAREICDLLPGLPIPELAKILKYGRDGGWTYLATEPLAPGDDVCSWIRRTAKPLTRRAPASPAPAGTPPVPSSAAGEKPGGGLNRSLSLDELASQLKAREASHSSSPATAQAVPSSSTGEFTRLYGRSEWTAASSKSSGATKPLDEPELTPSRPVDAGQPNPRLPGLETFIGLSTPGTAAPTFTRTDFEPAPRVIESMPTDFGGGSQNPPLPPAPVYRQPVDFDAPAPGPGPGMEASRARPVSQPGRSPLFDLRTFLVVTGVLSGVVAMAVLVIEYWT